MIPPLAIFLCFAVAGLAIYFIYAIFDARACNRARPRGRHARPFADPADRTDPDGSIWLKALHHDELPAAGRLAIEPVPPEPETRPQPAVKDVAACELGMSVQDYVDGVFAPAEATLNAMAATYYAEVTR